MPPETSTRHLDALSPPTLAFIRSELPALAIAAVGLLAVLLGDRADPWGDEHITIRLVEQFTPWEILTVLPTRQPHLPIWYLLPEFAGWEVTAAISAVALPVTVYATVRAGRVLYGHRPALMAGALVALSPFLVEQAGWMRMYAPLTALMALGLWFTLESRWRAAAGSLLAAAAIHVFGWFGPAWLSIVTARDRPRFAVGLLFAGSIPGLFLASVKHLPSAGLSTQTTNMGHGRLLTYIDMGLIPTLSLSGAFIPVWFIPGIIVLSGLIFYRSNPTLQQFVALPILGISAATWFLHPVYVIKYFGFVAPAVALMAVDPEKNIRKRLIILVALSSLYALSWSMILNQSFIARRIVFF